MSGYSPDAVSLSIGQEWPPEVGHPLLAEPQQDETEGLKKLAAHLLSLTTRALDKAQGAGELMKVDCDAKD